MYTVMSLKCYSVALQDQGGQILFSNCDKIYINKYEEYTGDAHRDF